MKTLRWLWAAALAAPLALAGCSGSPTTAGPQKGGDGGGAEAKIRANLDRLAKEDRALAEAQKYCPQTGERLGAMGVPVQVTVKDRPVFLCCDGCEKDAVKGGDETLQKVEKLKARAKAEADKHD
jgi:hypothetical protein